MLSFDRTVLAAFGGVGAVGVLLLVLVPYMSPLIVLSAAVFVLLFAPAVASRRVRTGAALLAAWLVAVVAASALNHAQDSLIGEAIFTGGVLGTFLFGVWVIPSFLLVVLRDRQRTKFKV